MAYNKPDGPPPSYPPQAHYDAGPVGGDPRGAAGYYGSPPPQQYGSPAPYGDPYGPPGGPPGGGYGPGPYGPPPGQYQQQPMYYQQQPYPPQGYVDNRGGGSSKGGICAGILGALACCCCLDFLF